MIIKSVNVEDFFIEKVKNISSREDTKAYIVSVFSKYKSSQTDLSKEILLLEYIKAQENHNFEKYQNLADWILFIKSMYPENKKAMEELHFSMAQIAYYKCYVMINRSWILFEELADNLPQIIKSLNNEIARF